MPGINFLLSVPVENEWRLCAIQVEYNFVRVYRNANLAGGKAVQFAVTDGAATAEGWLASRRQDYASTSPASKRSNTLNRNAFSLFEAVPNMLSCSDGSASPHTSVTSNWTALPSAEFAFWYANFLRFSVLHFQRFQWLKAFQPWARSGISLPSRVCIMQPYSGFVMRPIILTECIDATFS